MTNGPDGAAPGAPARVGAAAVPADLLAAKALVYDPGGFTCSTPVLEPESAAYGACCFTLDGRAVRFRVAGTTPTKAGQFVTVWQRSEQGPIRPFDSADGVDLFVVSSRSGRHFGQFVFPGDVLRDRGVVSGQGVGGKRAFRVYPPRAEVTVGQARSTQRWQVEYYLAIVGHGPVDAVRARALYHP